MSEQLVKVATKADIPAGTIKGVEVAGQKIAICQTEGAYYAIGDVCSHAKVLLHGGQIVGDQIECPKHGAHFDLKTGKAMCPPAVQPVPTYRVEVRGEELWIAVPEN